MKKRTGIYAMLPEKISASGSTVAPVSPVNFTAYYNNFYINHTSAPGVIINIITDGSRRKD